MCQDVFHIAIEEIVSILNQNRNRDHIVQLTAETMYRR